MASLHAHTTVFNGRYSPGVFLLSFFRACGLSVLLLLFCDFITGDFITSSNLSIGSRALVLFGFICIECTVHTFRAARTSTTPSTQVKHSTSKMVRVLKSNSSASKIPSIEIHEPPQEHDETIWRTKMQRIAVQFASTFIGQAIMMQFDKLLWTLEKTATWISSGKTGKRRFAFSKQKQENTFIQRSEERMKRKKNKR